MLAPRKEYGAQKNVKPGPGDDFAPPPGAPPSASMGPPPGDDFAPPLWSPGEDLVARPTGVLRLTTVHRPAKVHRILYSFGGLLNRPELLRCLQLSLWRLHAVAAGTMAVTGKARHPTRLRSE